MSDRVKEIRTTLKMNQADFSNLLGIGQSTLAMMEVSKRKISDRHVKTICSICNVNETWLRTGEGEMYLQTDDTLFAKLSKEYNLSVGMQELLRAILDLDDERREQLVDFAVYFNSRLAPATETSATVSDIDKQVADYRKELEAEQKGQLALQNLGEEKKA